MFRLTWLSLLFSQNLHKYFNSSTIFSKNFALRAEILGSKTAIPFGNTISTLGWNCIDKIFCRFHPKMYSHSHSQYLVWPPLITKAHFKKRKLWFVNLWKWCKKSFHLRRMVKMAGVKNRNSARHKIAIKFRSQKGPAEAIFVYPTKNFRALDGSMKAHSHFK